MNEFKTCKLSEVTTLITKGTTPTTLGYPFTDTGINFIKAESVTTDGQIDESVFAHIDEVTHAKLKRSQIIEGDILFSIAGMKLGKSAVVKSRHVPANTNQAVAIIRADRGKALPSFLHYHFLNPDHYRLVNAITAQSAQPNINLTQIGNLQISLPSIDIQQRIADILSAYDELIENSQRRIKVLETMARALYREWFVHFRFPGHESIPRVPSSLGEIPRGWEATRLGDLIEIRKGKNITKETIREGIVPVVAGGLSPAYFHDTANTQNPVITISASGANAGFVNLYHMDIWASDCSYIDKATTPHVYYYHLWLDYRRAAITHLQRGSAQPHVYPKDLAQLEAVRVPDELLEAFSSQVEHFYGLTKRLAAKVENLRRTRDLLLPRLLSGQIDVEAMPA